MRAAPHVRWWAAALGIAGLACTSPRQLNTAPQPGMKVVVDLYPSRSIAVAQRNGDLALFDSVTALDGKITRVSADTVWLSDFGVRHGAEWSWPHDTQRLAVAGIGTSAAIRVLKFDGARTAGLAFGTVVVATALFALLVVVAISSNPDW